ncbi:MAG: T9SS type A sorting domain-containing protein [Crocinitomicaceae bacterium]
MKNNKIALSILILLLLKISSSWAQCNSCPQYLDDQTGTLTWTTGYVAYQEYCLINDVTIVGNINISGSKVKIAPDVTITVSSGSVLQISGSHLYACSEMWNGIVVEPGARLVIVGNYINGTSNPVQSSLIEDAKIAVDVQDNPLPVYFLTFPTYPFQAGDVIFNKNHIGVKLGSYNVPIPAFLASGLHPIYGCMFTCRDIQTYPFAAGPNPGVINWPSIYDIKPPVGPVSVTDAPYINSAQYPATTLVSPYAGQKPAIGLYIENNGVTTLNPTGPPTYSETKLGYLSTWNGSKENIFDNHQIGITAVNSNITISNCIFQNLINTGLGSGIGIKAVSTGTNNNRLRVISEDGTNSTGNTFFNCSRGVDSENYFDNEISRNSFSSTQSMPGINQLGRHGVIASSNRYRNVTISKNIFRNIAFPIKFDVASGNFDVGNGVQNGVYAGRIIIEDNKMLKFLTPNSATDWLYTAIQLNNNPSFVIQGVPPGGAAASIVGNRILNAYNGIRTKGFYTRLDITNNLISLWDEPGNNPQDGIWSMNNLSQSTIENKIEGFNYVVDEVFSIRSFYCKAQLVECNEMKGTYFGASFYGDCSNTKVEKNIFNSHRRGLSLHQNGIIGVQGNSSAPSDNYWDGFWPVNPNGINANYKTSVEGFPSTMGSSYLWVRSGSLGFNPNGSCFSLSPYNFSTQLGTIGYASNSIPPSGCVTGLVKMNDEGERENTGGRQNGTNSLTADGSLLSLTIFPNPSHSGVFYVQNNKMMDKSLYVEVLTILGVKILSEELDINNNKIDLSDQPKGIYIFKISDRKSQIVQRVIID